MSRESHRLDGTRAALEALGVTDAARHAGLYAERKQKRLEDPIHAGHVKAFPDALRFVVAVRSLGWFIAFASSSKNANGMMKAIRLLSGECLLDVFDANVCGRDLNKGKPNPEIFLLAAKALHVVPASYFVIEDASAGIEAACAGHMGALGVARHDDAALLEAAGANLVVTSLDKVAVAALADGRLCQMPA